MIASSGKIDPSAIVLPVKLESPRLVLRPYQLSDAPVVAAMVLENRERLASSFSVRVTIGGDHNEAEAFIRLVHHLWNVRKSLYFGIWEKESYRYAGEVFIADIDWAVPKADLGYFVAREHEGKGIIFEAMNVILPFAFNVLVMNKLQIRCSIMNQRSRSVAQRCGFRLEGVLRNDVVNWDGRTLSDIAYFGMTSDDFRSSAPKPPQSGGFG